MYLYTLLTCVISFQKENPNLLKPREYKALLQVKHYLKYMFGMPYDENYYAGDWMLGPNSFCWQAMCSLGYDIYNNIGNMKPRNYEEINAVIKHMKDINTTVFQYISNMKLGITTGMVRTKIECLGGLNAMKQSYVKVSDKGPAGKLFVLNTLSVYTFFYKNTWFQFQPAVSYFSVYFQLKVFRILILIFVFEFPEHSSVKT